MHEADLSDSGIPEEMQHNMAYGHITTLLPYTLQDGYNRQRCPREFRVAVLENEVLRATFLLELGGRLWSLFHKPSGRELLAVNPVFQPANLALRNAWFSGGVEWNIGMIGHSPLTCSPLFASRVERNDGTPILRMYEWERIRQVTFQIDAWLPSNSPVLFVWVRITNPHDHPTPMYWWSNMAVPEAQDTRVITPADSAYSYGYEGKLKVIPVPRYASQDISYPARSPRAIDYFFHVPEARRPWIAALDGQGRGLVQVSTPRLIGRKLFLWGMGSGGRRWQEWLSESGSAYLEIQAGLARTQLEHLAMPAHAEWDWLEAYGLMAAQPAITHGDDWHAAQQEVEERLEQLVPRRQFEAAFEQAQIDADRPPRALLQHGSGWGALENLRREKAGEPLLNSAGLFFDPNSLNELQGPWLNLLEEGVFPSTSSEPKGYLVQAEWHHLLEETLAAGRCSGWMAWLHLGIMRYAVGDLEGAKQAWQQSLEEEQTGWALRNLAVLALKQHQADEAVRLYQEAHRLLPSLRPLTIELGQALLAAGRSGEWLEIVADLDEPDRLAGRIRLLEAQVALDQNDFDRAERILVAPIVVDDVREGELALSQLWFDLQTRRLSLIGDIPIDEALLQRVHLECPLPKALDFRMQ
jgi:tetratricopeptide (TPR) repeat protein